MGGYNNISLHYDNYNGILDSEGDYMFTDPNYIQEANNGTFDLAAHPFPTHSTQRIQRPMMGHSGMPNPLLLQLQHVLKMMQLYYKPFIIGIGFCGNTFSTIVMVKSNLIKFSYVNYLIALYIADSCYLFNLLCLLLAENGVNIYKLGAWCHFVIFLSQSSSFLSLWYLTSFLIDRFIALQLQYLERSLCTTGKAKVIIITFSLIAIAVFLNISLTVGVIITPGPKVFCTPLRRFAHSWKILDKIDVFINCIIPYLVAISICIGSFIGAHRERLLCSQHRRTILGPHRAPQPIQIYDSDLEKGRTCLFLVYGSVHLLLTLPSQMLRLIQTFSMWSDPNKPMNIEIYLWQQIFANVANARHAINIVILLFSYKGFRMAIKFLLIQLLQYTRKTYRKACRAKRKSNPISVKNQLRKKNRKRSDHFELDNSEGADIALTEVKAISDISSD